MQVDFNDISDDSRLWLYACETKLISEQEKRIIHDIGEYLRDWKYHGKPLRASVTILELQFIVVALDTSEYGVGGCSIDSLQRIIQKLEKDLSISLLNRLNIFCRIENIIKCIPTKKLSEYANKETLFYDFTIQRKHELLTWCKPIKKGWCKVLL
ncbi:MAG: hypothetical protein VX370_01965 [Bacteroidota bacterium]|nr:hypothetical protein [Bacteroidota bacterium]